MCTPGYGYIPTITQRSASALAMQAVHQEESFPTWGILAMCVDKEGKCGFEERRTGP